MKEDDITVAMATYSRRIHHAVNVIYELLPQCTRMCVCLNGYSNIPDFFPRHEKLIVICADGEDGRPKDLGCNNKMYWLGDFQGYYATVDDDIDYPPNYINVLKEKVDQYGKKSICSFHGHVYGVNNSKIDFSKDKMYMFQKQYDKDYICHRIGNGVAMSCPSEINLTKDIFMNSKKNQGDDEILSVWAQQNNIKLIRVSDKRIHLIEDVSLSRNDSLSTNVRSIDSRREYMARYQKWRAL